jgi:predicted nucleotidyltransferase
MAALHPDWRAFFESLLSARVEFVVVGALAVSVYAEPRYTADLDVFVRPGLRNARRLHRALTEFGFGDVLGPPETLAAPDRVLMLGRKPLRIDVLTGIDGVTFAEAWRGRSQVRVDGLLLPVIGLEELRTNKRAAGRPKDLADLAALDEVARRRRRPHAGPTSARPRRPPP